MEPPRHFLDRLIDFCITVVVCAFLLRLAVCWLAEVAPFLLALAALAFGAMVGYRLWKYFHNTMGKW